MTYVAGPPNVPSNATRPGSIGDVEDPDAETRILLRLGFRRRALNVARAIADQRRTTVAEELMRLRYLRASDWWQAVANDLGLRYFGDLYLMPKPAESPLPDARMFKSVRQVWHRQSDMPILIVAPRGKEIDQLGADFAQDPAMRRRVAIGSPLTIRRAFRRAYEPALTHQAINRLRLEQPSRSASDRLALTRRIVVCFLAVFLLALFIPLPALIAFDFLFLVAGGLRLAAALDRPRHSPEPWLADADLPSYAVMVPLFRETGVVGDLVRSLLRLDYPRARLSIYLIVEADDLPTLEAAQRATAGTPIVVIAVPPSRPRTKPKALVWALPFVEGELLTIYDAEDRPAPDQLRRAAAAFAVAGPQLHCLQAILEIDHATTSSNWLSRQFALEYRVQFRALLPWLARNRLFLPLGGTSNHFRRDALVRIGGWDPYNVTEDADVAVRLQRAGGEIGTLSSVTTEEAPVSWRAWHLQRTRWMKGWLQTWLVHMRHPRQLVREFGVPKFLLFQVLIIGQVLSALIYPFGATLVVLDLTGLVPLFADRDFKGDLLLAFELLALFCGWAGAAAAILVTRDRGRAMVRRRDLLTVPVYWLLLFGAAINAIAELIVDPHRWNKTGHGIAERAEEDQPARFPPRNADDIEPAPARPPLARPPAGPTSARRDGPT